MWRDNAVRNFAWVDATGGSEDVGAPDDLQSYIAGKGLPILHARQVAGDSVTPAWHPSQTNDQGVQLCQRPDLRQDNPGAFEVFQLMQGLPSSHIFCTGAI